MPLAHATRPPRRGAPLLTLATLTALGLAAAHPAQAQTTIDTTGQATVGRNDQPWGVTNTSTYGQTFIAPTDSVLNDFTFYLGARLGSAPINYQADVYAWDGSKATGSALFTSATQTFTSGSAYTPVFTSTGSTVLTAGQQYVAFLTTAGLQSGQPNSGVKWQLTDSANAYTGGNFVYYNTGNDASLLTSHAWDDPGVNSNHEYDTKFKMDFSPTAGAAPEPSQLAGLAFTAFGVLGLLLRARKRPAGPPPSPPSLTPAPPNPAGHPAGARASRFIGPAP